MLGVSLEQAAVDLDDGRKRQCGLGGGVEPPRGVDELNDCQLRTSKSRKVMITISVSKSGDDIVTALSD